MRSYGDILHKVKQILFRLYQRDLKEKMKVVHYNCVHNVKIESKIAGVSNNVCSHPNKIGVLCSEHFDCSKKCEFYKHMYELETLKKELKAHYNSYLKLPPNELTKIAPSIAPLIWVLSDDSLKTNFEFEPIDPDLAADPVILITTELNSSVDENTIEIQSIDSFEPNIIKNEAIKMPDSSENINELTETKDSIAKRGIRRWVLNTFLFLQNIYMKVSHILQTTI